jgi:hypothetical protein
MSRERFLISSLADLIRQSMRTPACSIGRFDSLHLGMDHRVKPGGDEKRGTTPKAHAAKGDTGIGAKSRHSSRRPSGASPMARPGRKRVAGTTTPGAPIAAMQLRATVAHPTVKQMSSFWNLYDMGP